MTNRALALAAVAVLLAAGCTRSTGSGGTAVTPLQIYTAGPTLAQVKSSLGDDQWWQGVPTFRVRPLDLQFTPEDFDFAVAQRFVHVGTPETFQVDYTVYKTSTAATSRMSTIRSNLGTNAATSPKVGDQVIYYGSKQSTSTALYEMVSFVRLGQIIITTDLTKTAGFSDLNHMSSMAKFLASRLQDVLTRKVRPSPLAAASESLLPPPGTDITLLGAARLPIEASADLYHSAAPQALVSTFTDQGVKDFMYGDYALNADLHMEVRAAVFNFADANQASAWINTVFGSSVNANGVVAGYNDVTKEYDAYFIAGSHIAWLVCSSTASSEAASRACETPLNNEIGGWHYTLAQVP